MLNWILQSEGLGYHGPCLTDKHTGFKVSQHL